MKNHPMYLLASTVLVCTISCTAYEGQSHYYRQGLEFGKLLIEENLQSDTSRVQNNGLLALPGILSGGDVNTEAYKAAFSEYKDYYRGLYDYLSSNSPSDSTKEDLMYQKINLYEKMAHAIANAPDIEAARCASTQIITNAMNDAKEALHIVKRELHKLGQFNLTVNAKDIHYQEGYAIGKQTNSLKATEAQGKPTSNGERALKQRIEKFDASISQVSSASKMHASWQYLNGVKKAFEECDIEALITRYKPSPSIAAEMRANYEQALHRIQSSYVAFTNMKVGLDELSIALEDVLKDLNDPEILEVSSLDQLGTKTKGLSDILEKVKKNGYSAFYYMQVHLLLSN